MKSLLSLLILLSVASATRSFAQISSLGEAEGDASLLLDAGASSISITSKDPNVKLSYQSNAANSLWGFDLIGKAKGDVASVLSGKTPYLSGTASIGFEYRYLFIKAPQPGQAASKWDFPYIALGLGTEKVKRFDTMSRKLMDTNWLAFKARLGYNFVTVDPWGGSVLLGAVFNLQTEDNTDTLAQVSVQDVTEYSNENGSKRETSTPSKSAYVGTYAIETKSNIGLDFLWVPEWLDHRLGVSIFTRSQIGTKTDAGLGFYLLQAKAPTVVQGGIVFEVEDYFNSNKSSEPTLKRGSIRLVVGHQL